MSATLFRCDGTSQIISPANDSSFTLLELQHLVGGYVDRLTLDEQQVIVNENSVELKLPINPVLTPIYLRNGGLPDTYVLGDALMGHIPCNSDPYPIQPVPGLYYQHSAHMFARLIRRTPANWLATLIDLTDQQHPTTSEAPLPTDLAGWTLIDSISTLTTCADALLLPSGSPGISYPPDDYDPAVVFISGFGN